MENIKINKLELENVKRVKAVIIEPTKDGLTVVGGRNGQGKTSILDAITWALGGNKYKPTSPHREGSMIDPALKIELSNGYIVERKGKNGDLKVTDPTGTKGTQQGLLDGFVEELALNLPKFMESSNKEKAEKLLQIIGVGDKLALLEKEFNDKYQERLLVGRTADQKEKYAKEQPYFVDAPKELVSASELIQQQQTILTQNGENARKRQKAEEYQKQVDYLTIDVKRLEEQLLAKRTELNNSMNNLSIAKMDAIDLLDQSTEALEESIRDTEEINRKVRANLDKEKAEEDAKEQRIEYNLLTGEIEDIRNRKMELLNGAEMPLEGLFVADGELTYKGYKWDNMSGAERLKVATAIVRKLNPKCGFVLMDKLEQMDIDTLNEFGAWLQEQGMQAIATRVSTGEECSIIIEDGYVVGQEHAEEPVVTPTVDPTQIIPSWKAGEF